ncbi:hypothetical protein [Novosphingobium sp. Rr 2-17]|uniref:hypothetical protein n=1 Tax=Novosphingobium sp. Rr 2-17 TaxID=555793 RepID=UPI0005B7B1F3|nr:hypothetical protein [Novosphingobium sp. Rr 2-17]
MVGENRIIAFGAGATDGNGGEALATEPGSDAAPTSSAEPWSEAWIAAEDEADSPSSSRGWIVPAIALALVFGWSALFIAASLPALQSGITLAQIPALIVQWAVPVLLIGMGWLLAMRHSTREAARFGNVARTLSTESALLERRLTTVNRELSLAREFVAAQSRDLETLGRLAAERLSHNAERLQDLVRDNGARVDSISTVSSAALDNMEKLRGQLPVIASSAKDVTNNIANAGRTAHAQIEEMIEAFNRLEKSGVATTNQVLVLREQVGDTLDGFTRKCEHLEQVAGVRFAALDERGEALRHQLDRHEVEALAAIRTRAAALSAEIEGTRHQLDEQEAQSLTSLRARLVALRDESDVVARALRSAEDRAAEALRTSMADLGAEQTAAAAQLAAIQQANNDALAAQLATLVAEAERMDAALAERSRHLTIVTEERQSRQVEQERHAIARLQHMLGELDGSIAERLERHRMQAVALGESAAVVTDELARYEAGIAQIARNAGLSEASLKASLSALTERLTAARATLAATDGDVEKLTSDSVRLLELIQASAKQTHSALPEALSVSEDRLSRLNDGLAAVLGQLRHSAQSGEALASGIESSGHNLDTLIANLSAAHGALAQRGEDHATLLGRLQASLADIDAATGQAAGRAGDELANAIGALSEALAQSVAALEDDSAARIENVASTLGENSAAAIDKAMRGKVAEISGQLEQAVAHASGVTREATLQLRDQIVKVDDLVGNLETRVSQAREQAEEQVDNDFARRAGLITDSLNSNAIDIATALSGEVSDTAWAAYLRGDRGIFTRRAVRLLDASETKAIQQIFERDDAFRAQVSRYIHDFEAILRQVLSTRDGNALGVTLLSSDMGKLYVALAQGIERLRS